jgi:hypothetical protein
MIEINGTCHPDTAKKFAAKGAVCATVHDRPAIVRANTWEPVSGINTKPYYVIARLIKNESTDVEAQGTPKADSETQKLVDDVQWPAWP